MALRAGGAEGATAKKHLHGLLLHAARFEVSRRAAALSFASRDSLDDLAIQAAGDALPAVLARLDEYRGTSHFSTWACKFALLEAGVALRRLAWQHRELGLDGEHGDSQSAPMPSAESQPERCHTLAILLDCIAEELTPHERQVVVALAIDGVPIDVLAERLDTTRGMLYEALHEARRKLRACLAGHGSWPRATSTGPRLGAVSGDEAAMESNHPSGGLPRPAGFEDRMGHQTPAAPPGRLSDRRRPCNESATDPTDERG